VPRRAHAAAARPHGPVRMRTGGCSAADVRRVCARDDAGGVWSCAICEADNVAYYSAADVGGWACGCPFRGNTPVGVCPCVYPCRLMRGLGGGFGGVCVAEGV
jgi:hypothetical protein